MDVLKGLGAWEYWILDTGHSMLDARPTRPADGRLAVAAGQIGDTPLVFSHPVYQYLIRRYELTGVEVHWEPDEAPDGHAWDHFEELLETHPARWMLWEGLPLEATVAGLAEIEISSVVFDPCGNRPEAGDYLTVMATNAAALEDIAR